MKLARRVAVVAGTAGVLTALGLLFWPLNEPGVAGSAALPRYRDFGWVSYTPMPAHPSKTDLRRAGVSIPQDLVRERRLMATATVTAAALALGLTWASRPTAPAM